MNDIINEIELLDCPLCHGGALLEEEGGWCHYVTCMECGCHTAEVSFEEDGDRLASARKAATLWNQGKVLSHHPGE